MLVRFLSQNDKKKKMSQKTKYCIQKLVNYRLKLTFKKMPWEMNLIVGK
jgi:hypothetical protein